MGYKKKRIYFLNFVKIPFTCIFIKLNMHITYLRVMTGWDHKRKFLKLECLTNKTYYEYVNARYSL